MQILHCDLPVKAPVSHTKPMRVPVSVRAHASRLDGRAEFQLLTEGPVVLFSKLAKTCC